MENHAQSVVFDFDGVLMPTETLYGETHAATVREFGGTAPADFYVRIRGAGRPHEEVRHAYIRQSGIAVSDEMYTAAFRALLNERLAVLKPTPGIPEMLERLHARGRTLAIASSSPQERVQTFLDRAGMAAYFAAVVGGNEVTRKKPAPDVYRLALERLGASASEALAIEDSESGGAAARAAGIRTAVLRQPHAADHDFSSVWRIVSSVNELGQLLQLSA